MPSPRTRTTVAFDTTEWRFKNLRVRRQGGESEPATFTFKTGGLWSLDHEGMESFEGFEKAVTEFRVVLPNGEPGDGLEFVADAEGKKGKIYVHFDGEDRLHEGQDPLVFFPFVGAAEMKTFKKALALARSFAARDAHAADSWGAPPPPVTADYDDPIDVSVESRHRDDDIEDDPSQLEGGASSPRRRRRPLRSPKRKGGR